jgi:peroxiredoxin
MLKEGEPAPDFRLPADDGSELSQSEHARLYDGSD